MRILALVCLVPALTCQIVSYEVFFLEGDNYFNVIIVCILSARDGHSVFI